MAATAATAATATSPATPTSSSSAAAPSCHASPAHPAPTAVPECAVVALPSGRMVWDMLKVPPEGLHQLHQLQQLPLTSSSSAARGQGQADLTLAERMGAACVGSVLVALTMTPLDVAKIRLQASENETAQPRRCSTTTHVQNPRCQDFIIRDGICEIRELKSRWPRWFHHPFAGCPDQGLGAVLRSTLREEGVRGLYAGIVPTIAMSIPNNVLYFAAYEAIRDKLRGFKETEAVAPVVGGTSARMVASAATAPLEFIRTRRQAGLSFAQIRAGVAGTGMKSLWRGTVPTLWRDVPFSAMYWAMYEGFKQRLTTEHSLGANSAAFISGGVAGSISAALTMPFDVLKTRVQVEMSCGDRSPGLVGNLRDVIKSDGPSGLFVGLVPRVLRAGPSCAIMIASYETVKSYLAVHQETL
eukprot:TRINITY_DN11065_c0_g1_i2.p1 TRINITY_DN11065_c0_g1~~TRINITY_DN11065_c0_g1_i2.p1  ORF type:complete len:414 (+),score=99.32 TRINITY_DN11065_c0_g1_i2:226-1467(+)